MPEIYVHAVKGRTLDQKRALVKDITDAVVKNFSVPVEAVTVEIVNPSRLPRPRAASCSAKCGAERDAHRTLRRARELFERIVRSNKCLACSPGRELIRAKLHCG